MIEAVRKLDNRFITTHNIVNDAQEGLDPRLEAAADGLKDANETIEHLKLENRSLKSELDIVKGLLFRYDAEIRSLRDKVTSLTARSMSNNVTISGITGDNINPKEDKCKSKVTQFLKDTMGLTFKEDHVQTAHRLGTFDKDKDRPVVVRCHHSLKSAVLKSKEVLKNKTNSDGKNLYVNSQIPDQWAEEKRERREIIKKAKTTAKKEGKEIDIEVKQRVCLYQQAPSKKISVPSEASGSLPGSARTG